MPDVTFDMADNSMVVHQKKVEPWRITLVDTGEETLTGGRLKRWVFALFIIIELEQIIGRDPGMEIGG